MQDHLDFLIQHSLTASVRDAHPSPGSWRRLRSRIEHGPSAAASAYGRRARVRPARRWAGVLGLSAQPYRLLAALLEVEPLSFYALRLMPERAVYNLRGVM
jgi:hypothetical protein